MCNRSRFYVNWDWLIFLTSVTFKSALLLASVYQISFNTILVYQIINVMPILLISSFVFLSTERYQGKIFFYLNLIVSLVFIVDIVYARAFGHLIGIHMVFAKGVTDDLGLSIVSLIKAKDFLFFVDLPLIFALYQKRASTVPSDSRTRVFKFAFAFLISLGLIVYQFNMLEASKNLGNVRLHALMMSPVGNHMYDIYRYIYERTDELDQVDIDKVNKWLTQNSDYPPSADKANLEGRFQGYNLIVIQVESLENIVINSAYKGQEITPNINRLMGNSLYFSNIYEQVRDGNSSDAELMFNTSIYPLSNGSAFLRFGENQYCSLPKLLNNRGYKSLAIHGDDKEFWNRDVVFPSLGFDQYIAEDEFQNKTFGGMGVLDEYLFDQALSTIDRLESPYYLFLITLTSHMPFNGLSLPGDTELNDHSVTDLYIKTISYTDECLGRFYDELLSKGLLEDTVVVIYGDHEGVHKYYETTLDDNDYQIPFIIHQPGMAGQTIDTVGGQVDMMPTIAYLMGIDNTVYNSKVMGRNILLSNPGYAVLPNGTVRGLDNVPEYMEQYQDIADTIIRGDYFDVTDHCKTIETGGKNG